MRRLNLEDVGAEVREQASAHRTRPRSGGLQHRHTKKGPAQIGAGFGKEVGLVHVVEMVAAAALPRESQTQPARRDRRPKLRCRITRRERGGRVISVSGPVWIADDLHPRAWSDDD